MKTERLDKILSRRGLLTEEQIERALLRQQARGGRLGTHLLYFRFLSEQQLGEALGEQFGVTAFSQEDFEIDPGVVARIRADQALRLQALPVGYTDEGGLCVAMADPEDQVSLHEVQTALGATRAEVLIAPESTLRGLIERYLRRDEDAAAPERIIELPDLFAAEASPDEIDEPELDEGVSILLLTRAAALKNFLAPMLEREGYRLRLASDPESCAEILRTDDPQQVLVHQPFLEEFNQWVRAGHLPPMALEISVLPSVSSALLENPVPYRRMTNSLLRSVQTLAAMRCAPLGWVPMPDRLCRELREIAPRVGFRRVAVDGLQLAAHLLVMERVGERDDRRSQRLDLVDFNRSVELARSLAFAWDVAGALQSFLQLISELGRADDPPSDLPPEVFRGAQLLALAWCRHFAIELPEADPEERMTFLKSRLRERVGRTASSELVEAYVRHIEDHRQELTLGAGRQVFVVSSQDTDAVKIAAHLTRAGFRTLRIKDLQEASTLAERQAPVAILLDYDCYRDRVLSFQRRLRTKSPVLTYAYTSDNNASVIIDLLDSGFRDVFTPPFNYDVVATHIQHAVDESSLESGVAPPAGTFSASFEAFSFVELIQALGQSRKTVKLSLANSVDASAVLYLLNGDLHHARCGDRVGEAAVYEIIRWGDDGWFRAESVLECAVQNVRGANDAILLEGCRRLDESASDEPRPDPSPV